MVEKKAKTFAFKTHEALIRKIRIDAAKKGIKIQEYMTEMIEAHFKGGNKF